MNSRREWIAIVLGCLAAAAVAARPEKATASQAGALDVTYYYLPG